MLNSLNPSTSIQPTVWAQAWSSDTTVLNVLGPELRDVVLAQCNKYQLAVAQAVALMFFELGVANQGACHIEDEGGTRIPLTLNCVLIGPAATGPILTQALAADLTAIEIEAAPDAIEKQAMFKAAAQLRLEQRRQIDAEIKVAVRRMVRLHALLAQRRELEVREPKGADYPDHKTQLIAWNQRKEDLQISIAQAELEGDSDTVKALRKALNALLATPPSSFESVHRVWSLKIAAVESQIVLLQGADEEVAHLNTERQALLMGDARAVQPVTPKLAFLNVAVSAVHKAVTTQWPVANTLYSGAPAIKALIRHREAVADAGSGQLLSAHTPGRVQLGIFAATTPEVFMRDVAAAGADGAVALANLLILADLPQQDRGLRHKPSDPDCLAAFDAQVRAMGAASVRALLSDDFVPVSITIWPDAAATMEAECNDLCNQRFAQRLHPVMDAFLMMRARQTICVIAGLLYLRRRQTGPLSVSTMQDAITVGRFLIGQMGYTVAMMRQPTQAEQDTQILHRALHGHVLDALKQSGVNPFEISLTWLNRQAPRFGLTRARVKHALALLVENGLVRERQVGLEIVLELHPSHFAVMAQQ